MSSTAGPRRRGCGCGGAARGAAVGSSLTPTPRSRVTLSRTGGIRGGVVSFAQLHPSPRRSMGARVPDPFVSIPAESSMSGVTKSGITNGHNVYTDAEGDTPHPAFAQLRFRTPAGTYLACGGIVVHAWTKNTQRPAGFWILTAAHGIANRNSDMPYTVNVWANRVTPASVISNTQAITPASANAPGWKEYGPDGIKVFVHPLYSPTHYLNDVALIRCELPGTEQLPSLWLHERPGFDPVVNAKRIARLPSQGTVPSTCTIVGFGVSLDKQTTTSPVLQDARVDVEPQNVVQQITRHRLYSSTHHTWVSGPVNSRGEAADPCQGDSGGPLLCVDKDERVVAHALASWRVGCGIPQYPGVYARVFPFVNAPALYLSNTLPGDSIWRRGIRGIVNQESPVSIEHRESEYQRLRPQEALYA